MAGTGGSYEIAIIDDTTGDQVGECSSGSSCTLSTVFYDGNAHTYSADIESTYYAGLTYGRDVQTTSNTVSASRAPWTIALTGTTTVIEDNPLVTETTLTATTNQLIGDDGGSYEIRFVDYTNGDWYNCTGGGGGTTYSCTYTYYDYNSSVPDDVYYAEVSASYLRQLSGSGPDIQAVSNGFSAQVATGAVLSHEANGGSNPSENNSCGCTHGDPIDTATGEFDQSATDDSIPGAGPALSVTRTYSSADAGADGPFGYGWSPSFGPQLATIVSGDSTDPLPRQVQITQENGSTVEFGENPDQTYSPPTRVLATLTNDPVSGDWTFTRRNTQVFVFNAVGHLITSKDLQGNTVTYGYTSDQVTSITGSGGRYIDLTWSGGQVIGLTDSAGRSVTYAYDEDGNLFTVAAIDSSDTSYGYDANHLLTTLVKPDGGTTTNTYDTSNRVVSQEDPVGRTTTFSYDGGTTKTTAPDDSATVEVYDNGLLTSQTRAYGTSSAEAVTYTYDSADDIASQTDQLGKVTSYTYDVNGDQLTTTDPLSRTTTSTYDDLGDVLTVTDPLSRETTATYDDAGDKLTATSPSGRVQHWAYNTNGTVATAEDARGKTTTYGYNSAGDQTSVTDPDSRETLTAYNTAGIVTSTTDPGGNATTYTTDAVGRVLTATDPNSHTTTYTYDADGNKTSAEDADGHTTTYVYDAADQLTSSTVPGSHTTTYTYTDAGQPESTTDPNGHVTSKAYNALGLVTSSTDGDGHVTHYGYDGDGRETSVTLPSGDESTVTYDDAGQKSSSTDATGKTTTYGYDNDGELTSTTDPLSRVTSQSYTADGQVHVVTLPDSSTATSTYNVDGQLTDFENADGAHTTYSYDDAGLLTSKTEPGSITTSYTYTTAGQLHVTTNPDATTVTDSYNAGGLLTGVGYSASSAADVSYTYDAENQRTGMTDASGSSSYSYNSRGLMTSETNGDSQTIGYEYDDANQLTSITYPGDKTVTYGYDDAGQMTSLTDSASNETDFTWTDDGQLATQADPNGITQTRSYDADDRTTGISTANSSTTLADYSYGYDNAGELTSGSTIDPNNTTAVATDYGYNSLSQLTTVDNGTTSASYTNTQAGSITENTAGSALAYNTAEEVTSLTPGAGPSTTYGYDGNGNRTSSTVGATETTAASTTSYGYDPAGNLASVGIPATGSTSAQTVTYTSDGDGLRQTRTDGSTTANFLWDTNGSLPLLLDDGTYSYLYGPSSAPIAEVNDSTGTIRYLTDDLIGSTRLITSSTGSVVGVNIYDEYGNLTSQTGTARSSFGYSGNWIDPDTGLLYLRARDYDAATAQFLSVDPFVDLTRQPYTYVADNPLDQTDSSGRIALLPGAGSSTWAKALRAQVRNLGCDLQKFGIALRSNWIDFTGTVGGAVHDWVSATHPNPAIDSTKDPTEDSAESFAYALTDLGNAETISDRVDAAIELVTAVGTSWLTLDGSDMARYVAMRVDLFFARGPSLSAPGQAADEATTGAADAAAPEAGSDTSLAATNAELASAEQLEDTPGP